MAHVSLALQCGLGPVDEARLAELVQRYLALVWRLVRRLGLPAGDADDATQEVFLLAARRLADIVPGHERAFLVSAAVRIAASTRRRVERRREVPHEPDLLAASALTPERLLEQRQARALFDAVVDELDEELRPVFVLFEVEDLSRSEIAEALGLAEGTVASRLRRARLQFEAKVTRLLANPRTGDRRG